MKTGYVAMTLFALSIILVLPANALTPRVNFDDNHYTFLTFGSIRICGDHICKQHEWDNWLTQLMQNQLKNGGALPQEIIPGTIIGNQTNASSGNLLIDTSSGKITRVTTFDMGNNEFSSFVSISYNGNLEINHIAVSQTNSGISILRAWIEPQWNSNVKSDSVSFDSNESALYHARVINVVLVTDGEPSFSLDTLSSNQFP
jgi:hypothetical protein